MIKKKCNKCERKISSNYDFCPYCGSSLNKSFKKDWGMLGKSDFGEGNFLSGSFFEKITGGMMGKMLNNAMKMLEKEMNKGAKNSFEPKFKLMINGREVPLNSVSKKQPPRKEKKAELKNLPIFSEKKRKQFQNLERVEPKTNLKRFADKVIYELEIPGLNSIEDVSILRLENSLEIKAIGNKNAYEKIIRINSSIISYAIEENNLILEFGVN